MPNTKSSTASERIAGSFRDPSGYVFRKCGKIYRAVDTECAEILRALEQNGTLGRLAQKGLLVRTRFVDDPGLLPELKRENPGFETFLEHETVEHISYPYEWSVSMLSAAATCTIDVQLALLEQGCSLKDATAYNIQFVDGRPKFIDISSIERPARLDMWFALGQF